MPRLSSALHAIPGLHDIKLKHKVVALISFLALVPVLGAILSYQSLSAQGAAQELAMQARTGQTYLERINGLVYAVVMDSRGIYMSDTWSSARPYGEGLLKNLSELERTTDLWAGTVVEEQREEFAKTKGTIGEFIGFRTELVRLAREASLPAARQFGDNDANRANRQALNEQLRNVSSHYETFVETTNAASEQARDTAVRTAITMGIISLLTLAAGIWLVIQNLARPIERMTRSILEVASGRTDVEIYGAGRHDEIGEIAGAVEVFKQNLLETERLR
ncbi:MAG TPA: HAMP domain-containing protein, partial [Hyphomicrobium sp.]|nr:HAMP domain-containing protein [Hyphomicrobium sp.]